MLKLGFNITTPLAPIAPIARNSVQAIGAIHCFNLIAPIACEVECTGQVLPGSEFNIFLPDGIKDGKRKKKKSKRKDRGFLSVAVDDIAAQNKGSPRCTEPPNLGTRNVSEKRRTSAS